IQRSRYASSRETCGTKTWRGTAPNAAAMAGERRQPFDRSASTSTAQSAFGSTPSGEELAFPVCVIGLTNAGSERRPRANASEPTAPVPCSTPHRRRPSLEYLIGSQDERRGN